MVSTCLPKAVAGVYAIYNHECVVCESVVCMFVVEVVLCCVVCTMYYAVVCCVFGFSPPLVYSCCVGFRLDDGTVLSIPLCK